MFSTLRAALAFLLISGCTTYQPVGFGGGFSETPLRQDVYRIDSRGNAFASARLVNDIALVRAAELTLQKGYSSFVVLDQAAWEKQELISTGGGQSYSTSTGTASVLGNTIIGSSQTTTTYSPPQTFNVSKPQTSMIVKMFKAGEAGSNNALNPREIIQTIGPRVGYSK